MAELQNNHSGSCLCGAVQYTVSGAPIMAGHCHCIDCRKSAGTGHVTLAMFDKADVEITGRLAEHSTIADSGETATRSFCPTCGGRLFSRISSHPEMLAIMAGTLDNPEAIQPQFSVFNKNHLSWDMMDPAVPAFDEMPPHEDG